ncbi:hypothetical protein [Peribacillus frigoritolerans]|uniref:hypothetical protein n=1 Tax=Peribacillus frigoritolerans TaxID=450367 RepID=UPI002079302C|nr:hypothetical protein [Peribacillus frigoritolerans]USK67684.1 hypothetical protein LIT26_14415 [Peribacillus frigoritolerans]
MKTMERSLSQINLLRKAIKAIKAIKESTTDSESVYYVKDERTKQLSYSIHRPQTVTVMSWE